MGKNNQQRRAAKARARRRAESRSGSHRRSHDWGHDSYDPTSLAVLCDVLTSAARECADGDADVAREVAETMLGPGSPVPAGRPEQAAGLCFASHLPVLWKHGWQPVDLSQVVRRGLGPLHHEVLVLMLAEEIRAYPQSSVDVRWRAQLADLGAVPAAATGVATSAAWATRIGTPSVEALSASIELLATLSCLPPVAVQLPPPGTATAGQGATALSAGDERALARVRALLAKAESTSFEEEAEAYSAKAQELMARYSLHRLMAEAAEEQLPAITSRRMWLEAPYAGAKAILVQYVAAANRCSAVWAESLGFVTVVGHERDLSGVELLVTSLLVQATRAMVSPSATVAARRSRGGTRSFRQSFLVAYAARIGERLAGSAETAVAEISGVDLLPVLRADAERVEDERRRLFPSLVHKPVACNNVAGRVAGRTAADLAVLESRPQLSDDRAAS